MIKIWALGGYDEIGRNMTAIQVDDEVVICDMGIHLENFIAYTEDKDLREISEKKLRNLKAIPDDTQLQEIRDKVIAIVPSHAHLDHIAAIPFMAGKYNAPVYTTPYSIAVLKAIMRDNGMRINNNIIELNPNNKIKLSKNITLEFVNITHSIPQTVLIAFHTKYGSILYACDFKLDNHPGIGKKPNYKRLEEIGNNCFALFCDSTYSAYKSKMPSEAVAVAMLNDVLMGTDNKDNLVIVTTFSSHLARIKSIIDLGHKMKRKIILLGRSLSKYILAGVETNIFQLPDDVELVRYSSKINKALRKVKNRKEYLLVVTGHQGERNATLSKLANSKFDFKLKKDDHVVFSCNVIPTESNIKNREELEEELDQHKVRIFRDIHVSGHAAREDHRFLLNLLKPKHVIPAHGSLEMRSALRELCLEMGYEDKRIIMLSEQDSHLF